VAQDVNDDGAISPIDVLQVVNYLNQGANPSDGRYFDVSGDGQVSPLDALNVINHLNTPTVHRALDTVVEPNGLIQGRIQLEAERVVTAKAKVNQGPAFDLQVDASGNFVISLSSLGLNLGGTTKVTMYLVDATDAIALRQLTIDLPPDFSSSPDSWLENESGIRTLLSEGLLSIEGTDSDDNIVVSEVGEYLVIDGFQRQFAIADVQWLVVDARGGNDEVLIEGTERSSSILTLVDGGTGDDVIISSLGVNALVGGDGNDIITGSPLNDYITGGSGDDSLHGGDGDDVIEGTDGDDTIYGDGGHDLIEGGAGRDAIWGG